MIEVLPESHDNVILFRSRSTLTHEDYENVLIPKLEAVIAEHGKAKALFDFGEDFQGMELEAMWDDTKFGMKHRKDFDKIAVVGGPDWFKWATKIGDVLTPGDIKPFSSDEFDKALSWLQASALQYEELPGTNIMEITIDGKVTVPEYTEIVNKSLAFLENHDKVKIMKVYKNFDGFDVRAIKENAESIGKFYARIDDFTHAAIVSDEMWMEQMIKFLQPAYPCKMRAFKLSQLEEARDWLKSCNGSGG